MFIVMENDKPARYPECNIHSSWCKCEYQTFEEARSYLMRWLGGYSPKKETIKLNTPYYYSGHSDFVIIKEAVDVNKK